MPVINFGIVGLGYIGKIHAKIIASLSNARLIGVVDNNESIACDMGKMYSCKIYDNLEEMLKEKKIDAISVCLPSGMHYEAVIKSANAEKHVIVEKPLEIGVERAEKMVETCHKNNIKLCVILQHRFDDAILNLKAVIDKGLMGDLCFGTSKTLWYRDSDYFLKNAWRGTPELDGGGALINQSIHYIDLLQYIMGPVEKVYGKCSRLYHKYIRVEDTGIALLVFKNGALGSIEGTTIAYPGISTNLDIYGANGTVCIKNDKLVFYKFKTGSVQLLDEILYIDNPPCVTELDITSHKKQYKDFIESINENRDPLVNGEEGIKSLALVEAIYKSSNGDKWVKPLY